MSVQWLSWVFENSAVKGTRRLVLLSLANHADDLGVCWPSMETIASEAGVSRRRAEDAVRGLVADGLVVRDINAAPAVRHAGYRPNLYRIVREGATKQAPLNRPALDETGPPYTSGPDETGPPESSVLGVDDFDQQPPPNRRTEPSVEPSVEPSAPTTQAVERFEEHFWPVYPKRHGRRIGKKKALEHWKKLSVTQQRRAVMGARAYAAHCQRTNSFPKDAERWLRDRLWEEWLTSDDGPDLPQQQGIGAAADLPNGGRLTVVPSSPEERAAMGFTVGATP